MKKLILTCLCVILLHALPSYAVLVDFESITGMTNSPGTPIPGPSSQLYDQLSSLDILFTSGSPYVAVVYLGSGHATSGVNGIGGSTSGGLLTYHQSSPIKVSFFDNGNTLVPMTTDFVSIRGDNQTTSGFPVWLYAYDLYDNLIGRTQPLTKTGWE